MRRILALAALLTLVVIAFTQIVSYAVWGGMPGGYDRSIIVAGILIPLATCFPICTVLLFQRRKLAAVLERLELAHRELHERASHDPMTGLLNRQAFFEWLHAKGFDAGSFLMIDVDHFKAVNDTHGHAAGDEALRLVASALAGEVDKAGPIARFGGEEFCVFLPFADMFEAEKLAEMIRRGIGRLDFSPKGERHRLTVSVGVAALQPQASVEAALSAADAALYEAKRAGRNRVVCGQPQSPGRAGRSVA